MKGRRKERLAVQEVAMLSIKTTEITYKIWAMQEEKLPLGDLSFIESAGVITTQWSIALATQHSTAQQTKQNNTIKCLFNVFALILIFLTICCRMLVLCSLI